MHYSTNLDLCSNPVSNCLQDDALSALDVHVGTHIFERAVMGYAKETNRTIIMVTHQLQHLEKADLVSKLVPFRLFHYTGGIHAVVIRQ